MRGRDGHDPWFFLDKERIVWTAADEASARCRVSDGGLETTAELTFRPDGSLESLTVDRLYDRGKGKSTLEKFIGKSIAYGNFDGLNLATVFDGSWNLPEGDLPYVHFIVDAVDFEH